MFPPLPYGCNCLNGDSDDKCIKRVCSKFVCTICVAGCEEGGGQEQERLKGDNEYCCRICSDVVFDSIGVRWSSAPQVEMNRKGGGRPELGPLIIFVERQVSALYQYSKAAWDGRLIMPSRSIDPPNH